MNTTAADIRTLTVLICTHNRVELLSHVIDSLNAGRQPAGWKVRLMVVANACTDGTHDFLDGCAMSSRTLPLQWIAEPTPGKFHALNRALPLLEDALVAFVDDDHRVHDEYLVEVTCAAERCPEADLICGRILPRQGNVRYRLKTPYRDGTTHVIFEPLDFIARLAALVPKPRVNLTRFHGVFAPNSHLRSKVTPGSGSRLAPGNAVKTASERRAAMSWAQRLKRVFRIDIETCRHCGGRVKVIASIEDPGLIKQLLDHLDRRAGQRPPAFEKLARAPPQGELPGL